jgi:hypothetical protein
VLPVADVPGFSVVWSVSNDRTFFRLNKVCAEGDVRCVSWQSIGSTEESKNNQSAAFVLQGILKGGNVGGFDNN